MSASLDVVECVGFGVAVGAGGVTAGCRGPAPAGVGRAGTRSREWVLALRVDAGGE